MPYIGKSPQFGVRSRFYYTQSSAGGTSVSGTDDNGKTLKFNDGEFVDVMLNGVTLVAGTDYNTSTANTIAGLAALSNGDVVEVIVSDTFSVSDTVSAKDGGTFSGNMVMGGTLSVTGASTASGGLNVGTIKEATGTTTAMTIDSSGRVNLGVPVHGHFRQTASAASLGSVATLVKLTLDSTYEQSGGFSLASNEVTVPLTGRYRWSVAIALDVSAARRAISFVLYKNGSIDTQNQFTHFAFPYVSGTTHNMLTASNTINCTAGDDVSLYLREYDNNSMTVSVYHFTMDFIG